MKLEIIKHNKATREFQAIKETRNGKQGWVFTKHGIVLILSFNQEKPITILSFVWNGRTYFREYNRYYSNRFLVTVCKRFTRYITQQQIKEQLLKRTKPITNEVKNKLAQLKEK